MGHKSHKAEVADMKTPDMKTLSATVRDSGEGEKRWFCGGGRHTWLATSEETGGAFLLVEFDGEQGKVTPVHIHPASDETFYILDGEILLYLDGRAAFRTRSRSPRRTCGS
jgi:quercetin dioxygenase-like cupin family protein